MKPRILAAGILVATTGLAAAHDTTPLEREMSRQAKLIEDGRRMGDLTFLELRRLQEEQVHIGWMLDDARSDGSVTAPEYRSVERALQGARRNIRAEASNDHLARWRLESSDGNSEAGFEGPRVRPWRWGFGRWGSGYGRYREDAQ
jgi:hypothetical protein